MSENDVRRGMWVALTEILWVASGVASFFSICRARPEEDVRVLCGRHYIEIFEPVASRALFLYHAASPCFRCSARTSCRSTLLCSGLSVFSGSWITALPSTLGIALIVRSRAFRRIVCLSP